MPNLPDRLSPEEAMQDLGEKFSPGETTAVEGQPSGFGDHREKIPENYQSIFRGLCQKIAQRDMFARIEEVKKSAERRFAWRGMLDIAWNEDQWQWAQMGTVSGPQLHDQDSSDTSLHYPFNIFQAFGRGFITIVSNVPGVRMEATKVDAPDALRIASGADALRKKIEAQNDVDQLMEDVARLFWTDGRVSFYSRWVTDGSRFGYEDQHHPDESEEGLGEGGDPPEKKPRQPKGGEVVTPYGVLECKVPINLRNASQFPWRQLAFETDLTSAKATYPWVAKKLSGSAGQPGPGEYNFDRTTRIATTQGIRLLTQSGDTVQSLPTEQHTWMRPAMFSEIEEDADRLWFEDNYPDGAMVTFVGETYVQSRNESMDDHWQDCRPLPGDGQATPAAGEIVMPVQYALCDMTDLAMETFMKSIPAIWCNKAAVDLQSIAKQQAGPGAHYPSKDLELNTKMQDMFWPEPTPELPQQFQAIYQSIFGSIPQFLTGLFPAAVGEADTSNETLGGIKLLGQASKGQAGVAWRALRKAYAKVLQQLVRIGAYYRAGEAENGVLALDDTEIDLEDLRDGNWACVPDGDEAYPNTHSERVEAIQQFIGLAMKSPETMQLLGEPKNLALVKDTIGLQDLEIPGADAGEKQLSEIKELLEQPTIPNQQAILAYKLAVVQAQMTGQPPPPEPPPEQLRQPSIGIDEEFDDHQAEYTEGKYWVNSPVGQRMKREKPDGFLNVRLHLLLHKQALQKAQAAQMQQQVQALAASEQAKQSAKPAKTPAESINFKDLGPSGRLQVGKQAGLDLTADEAAELAGEAMGESQNPPAKPNGAAKTKVQ